MKKIKFSIKIFKNQTVNTIINTVVSDKIGYVLLMKLSEYQIVLKHKITSINEL